MRFINQVEPYITESEIRAVDEYMRSGGWITEFEKTALFEKMISEFLCTKYAVVVPNGTIGLYLALLAAGIGKGDSVIVPDFTMIASPNSVVWANADVLLCDTERDTLCLDLQRVRPRKDTKGLMYVSINGRSGDMGEIKDYCRDHEMVLIEDACQSFGSKWKGKYMGTFGDIGVFSFSPHKIITTGQGGAIVTNNEEYYDRVKKLKDFSRVKPGVDIHTGIGYNFKFTDLQAVLGIEQLKSIDFRMRKKREIYQAYMNALSESKGRFSLLPIDLSQVVPWFIDVICESQRDTVIKALKDSGVGSRPFYPPIHSQEPYKKHGGSFPVTEELASKGLWLPSSLSLDQSDIQRITGVLKGIQSF
jgi:perosamine synthetase